MCLSASLLRVQGQLMLIQFDLTCRQRLSNDSFSLFLQAIKELNSGKKSREDTLHTANDIFGASNGDLYGALSHLITATKSD